MKTYDNEAIIKKMVAKQENMLVPSELVPHCPVCGAPMSMNLRADNTFVEDDGWHIAAERYQTFIRRHRDLNIVYLELGVGGNTPGIIKYPFWQMTYNNPNAAYICIKLATPISNGGLTLTPPGYFSGSARGGISQYHFYWLPPKEGSPTFFRPPACRSLPVPEYISKSFLRLHSLLSKHSILAPRNACLPILFGTPDACQKASAYSSLSDMT